MEAKKVNEQELEAIKEKIRNILNRTVENGATEEEAKTAAALAQKLMARYGIDEKGIAHAKLSDIDKIDYVWARDKADGYELRLGNVIAKNFRTVFVQTWFVDKGMGFGFWGRRSDAEVASATYMSMLAILWANAIKTVGTPEGHKTDKFYWERIQSFGQGFVEGLREALTQNAEKYALVLVMDQECEEERKRLFRTVRRKPRSFSNTSSDYINGRYHGSMALKSGNLEG